MVIAERDMPGTKAIACAHPMMIVPRRSKSLSVEKRADLRSAIHINTAPIVRVRAISHGSRRYNSIMSTNNKPAIAAGIVPMISNRPIRE